MTDPTTLPADPVPADRVAGRASKDRAHLEEILAKSPVRHRTHRMVRRGLVCVAASSTLAVAALATYLATRDESTGVEIRLGSDRTTPGSIGAPLDEWGYTATLTVAPRDGSALRARQAAERLAKIVAAPRSLRGSVVAPSATVLSVGSNSVSVRVPWVRDPADLSGLFAGSDVEVYDSARVEISSVKGRAALVAEGERLRRSRPDEPTREYRVGRQVGVPFEPSAPGAETWKDASGFDSVEVPQGVRIVFESGVEPYTYRFLRDEPLLRAEDIAGAQSERGGLSLKLTVTGRERIAGKVPSVLLAQVVLDAAGAGSSLVEPAASVNWSRDLLKGPPTVFIPMKSQGARGLAAALGRGGLPGPVTISDVNRYGTPPSRAGGSPAPDAVPAPAVSTLQTAATFSRTAGNGGQATGSDIGEIRPESLLRVLDADTPQGHWAIDDAFDKGGAEYYGVSEGTTSREVGSGVVSDCQLDWRSPLVALCSGVGRVNIFAEPLYGRVSSRIDRLDVVTKGPETRVHRARIENGWFLVALPDLSQPVRMVGRDRSGRPIFNLDVQAFFR